MSKVAKMMKMSKYAELIEQEEQKISLLKAKMAECEQRVAVLKSFVNADELDSVLTRSLASRDRVSLATDDDSSEGVTAHVGQSKAANQDGYKAPQRRLSEDVVAILRYVGPEGKTLSEIHEFCVAQNLGRNRTALRAMMSSYRKKHGFIESEAAGSYRLTTSAQSFLDLNYPENQKETSSAATEDVSTSATLAHQQADPDS